MIESLKFFKDREALAGPDGYQINRARAKDRTVSVVRKAISLSKSLKDARQATLGHCEAIEGKNGIVSLKVADRPAFEALQSHIKAQSEELAAIEAVSQKLDEMAASGELWYEDIESMAGGYGRTEFSENQRLSSLASAVLSRRMNTGKTTEQILAEDEDYKKFSKITSEQISNANKQLAVLRPKLAEMKQLLDSVGC
jgi:hypothetical protein